MGIGPENFTPINKDFVLPLAFPQGEVPSSASPDNINPVTFSFVQTAFVRGVHERLPLPAVKAEGQGPDTKENISVWADQRRVWVATHQVLEGGSLASIEKAGQVSRQRISILVKEGLAILWELSDDPVKQKYPLEIVKEFFVRPQKRMLPEKTPEEIAERKKQTSDRLSAALTGRTLSRSHRENLSAAKLGKKREPYSEEWRRNISIGRRRIPSRKDSQKTEETDAYTAIT
ncbi:MAG: hypothetical protein Q8Q49_02255 [bacterium]|nr:hypothetical protein [bacterium]